VTPPAHEALADRHESTEVRPRVDPAYFLAVSTRLCGGGETLPLRVPEGLGPLALRRISPETFQKANPLGASGSRPAQLVVPSRPY